MTALPINAKIAEGDTKEDGQRRFYGQIDIGPGDVQITAYESLNHDGVVIIDVDRPDRDGSEATPVKVAINDWYVDDTTDEKPEHFAVLDVVLGEFEQTRVQIESTQQHNYEPPKGDPA